MASQPTPCAASSLVAGLVDGPRTRLLEVARTRVSVHYETGDRALPVLCVGTPEAVRLPNSLLVRSLPADGLAGLDGGLLRVGALRWRVVRWWRPDRPSRLPVPDLTWLPRPGRVGARPGAEPAVPAPPATHWGLAPEVLVGAGPGLTPAGDDVLAGALVAAYATADPRLPRWRRGTLAALAGGRTTAVSSAMLHHAMDGYAAPELAAVVTALCLGRDAVAERRDLLRLGHTSGASLLAGVLHTLATARLEGAA